MQSRGAINKKDFLIPFNPKIFDLGYSEKNKKKKGLYSKECDKAIAYLDYRNVGQLPRSIQVNEGPQFYIYPVGKSKPSWQTRRVEKLQREILEKNGIRYRLSYYHESGQGDGYCCFCNKDFQDEGWCCSPECEILYKNQFDRGICAVCFAPFTYSSNERTIRHHVQYYPEEIVEVHESCHNEIHRGNIILEYPEYTCLIPSQDELERFYKKGKYAPFPRSIRAGGQRNHRLSDFDETVFSRT